MTSGAGRGLPTRWRSSARAGLEGSREGAAMWSARSAPAGIYPEYYAAGQGLPIVRSGGALKYDWNHLAGEE